MQIYQLGAGFLVELCLHLTINCMFIFNLAAFIVDLCWEEDISLENEKTYPQCKDVKNVNLINNNSDTRMDTEASMLDEKNRGRIWSSHPK